MTSIPCGFQHPPALLHLSMVSQWVSRLWNADGSPQQQLPHASHCWEPGGLWWFTPWFTSFVETSRSVHWGWLNVRNIRWPSDLVLFRFQSHFGIFISMIGGHDNCGRLLLPVHESCCHDVEQLPNSLGRLSKTAPKYIVLNYLNCELQVILDLFTPTNQPRLMTHKKSQPCNVRSDNSSWGRMRSWSAGRNPMWETWFVRLHGLGWKLWSWPASKKQLWCPKLKLS